MWESILQLGENAIHPLLVIHVVDEGFAEDAPHYLQVRWVEVQAGVHALVGAQEGGFECEAVDELELLPHDDTCGRLSTLLDDEGAVFETEHVIILTKQPIYKVQKGETHHAAILCVIHKISSR